MNRLFYKQSVAKDFNKIDHKIRTRIKHKIEKELSKNAHKGIPLKGRYKGLLRYRVGDYRVIYTIKRDGVLILRIAHRKKSYRKK